MQFKERPIAIQVAAKQVLRQAQCVNRLICLVLGC